MEDYSRWSAQTRLGAGKQLGSVVVKPELHAYWLHEFNASADSIDYFLPGGMDRHHVLMQAPDQDIFEGGVGISAMFNDRLGLMLGIDGRYSAHHEALQASGRISYRF